MLASVEDLMMDVDNLSVKELDELISYATQRREELTNEELRHNGDFDGDEVSEAVRAQETKLFNCLQNLLEQFLSFDYLTANLRVNLFLLENENLTLSDSDFIVSWMNGLFLGIHKFGYQLTDGQTLEDLQKVWKEEIISFAQEEMATSNL